MAKSENLPEKKSDETFTVDVASQTTKVSWTPPDGMNYDQWDQIGYTLQTVNRSLQWWLGDWLRTGESMYGEMYTQAIIVTDSALETLKKYKAVAERVRKEDRVEDLSWTHHFYMAYIPQEYHNSLLRIAEYHSLSSRELKAVAELPDDERKHLCDLWENFDGPEHGQTLMALRTWREYGSIYLPDGDEDENEDKADENQMSSAEHEVVVDGSHLTYDIDSSADAVYDYWKARGNPIVFCDEKSVEWEGMRLVSIIGEDGNPILLWDMVSVQ